MRAALFQAQVRRDLRGKAVVLMGKNTMIRRQVHSPRSMQARCRTLRSAIANMQ
jgi:ribosomal protein L6P/L9E